MSRPGVMIYFDILPALKMLPDAECGKLFTAMLEYAQFGVVPEFDGVLKMAWQFIYPKLDRDEEVYKKYCDQKKYAVFCREYKKANSTDPPSFEEWKSNYQSGSYQPISSDIERYPTTIATQLQQQPKATQLQQQPNHNTTANAPGKGERERENPTIASNDYMKQSELEFENLKADKIRELEAHLIKKGRP